MKSKRLKQPETKGYKSSVGCRLPAAGFFRTQSSVPSPGFFAFTLVELLVVVGIIGLIIAILLPSLGAVGVASKRAKTLAEFNSISADLEAYRSATDEPYPPSNTDALDNSGRPTGVVMTPFDENDSNQPIAIAGANLMVWALAGADLLGTPGFVDVDRDDDGLWSNDTHSVEAQNGLYALGGQDRQPLHRRYDPFIDITKADIVTIQVLAEDKLYPRNSLADSIPLPPSGPRDYTLYLRQLVMLDGFGYPILYYKANVGASRMLSCADISGFPVSGWATGIYTQDDNRLYTGDGSNYLGMDLGTGRDHKLNGVSRCVSSDPLANDLSTSAFDDTFAQFIRNRQITDELQVRNEPVNKDSYLLISPGPDALWGTDDDITNFNN